MTFLRRTLKLNAALWVLWGLAVGLFPRFVLETVSNQVVNVEYAWVRLTAIEGIALALLMVLVAQKIEDVWWWSWAFAILEALVATLCVINAAFGLPPYASPVLWWVLALVSAALAAALMIGMAYAGQERPFA
jgi:hypothetical protein